MATHHRRISLQAYNYDHRGFAHHFNNDDKGGDRVDDNEGYDEDDDDMSESGRCRLEQEGQEPMRLSLMPALEGNN